MSNINGFEFDWDSEIEHDAEENVLLPEGEYDFEVLGYDRQRYSPSANSKVPACPMAVVRLRVTGSAGSTTLEERLYLHSTFEWKLCQFFTCIGQRRKGEKYRLNWRAAVGARGRCRLGVRTWKDRGGSERQSNQVLEYLEPADQGAGTGSAYGGGF